MKRPAVARSRIQDIPLAWACSTCRGLVVQLLWLSGRALAATAGLLTLLYFCLLYLSSFIKDNHAWWYRLPTVTTALTHDLWLLTEVTSAVFLQVKKSNHSYNHSYSLPLPFCPSLPPSNYLSIHPSCGYLCSDFAISGDVKWRLWHTSRDERAQALCVNFVLQVMNALGPGTRLRSSTCVPLNSQRTWGQHSPSFSAGEVGNVLPGARLEGTCHSMIHHIQGSVKVAWKEGDIMIMILIA